MSPVLCCSRRQAPLRMLPLQSAGALSVAAAAAGCGTAPFADLEADGPWVAYLLLSPTRSSLAGAAHSGSLDRLVAWHNGELDEGGGEPPDAPREGPSETALLRPWRLADAVSCDGRDAARRAAWRVSRASGFRARLAALRACRGGEDAGAGARRDGDAEADLDLRAGLDGLTYVPVEFAHPADPARRVTVRALVDTGSSDCDLRQGLIDSLGLPADDGSLRRSPFGFVGATLRAGFTQVETAAGRQVEMPVYRALVRVMGREASVLLSPADEPEDGGRSSGEDEEDKEFGLDSATDDALLGSEALAALGLLVDCRNRRLVLPPSAEEECGMRSAPFVPGGPYAWLEVGNPLQPDGPSVGLRALVDSGSTDVDLDPRLIERLGLRVDPDEGRAVFETAQGVTVSAPVYRALARALGREASVRVGPSADREEDMDTSEEEEEEPGQPGPDASGAPDEALLGHDALAALGLLVDCQGRRLLAAPREAACEGEL